jgi:hypothetical protein
MRSRSPGEGREVAAIYGHASAATSLLAADTDEGYAEQAVLGGSSNASTPAPAGTDKSRSWRGMRCHI